jgi:hypothetical protein
MIPNRGLALACAALLLAGCGRTDAPDSPHGAKRKEAGAGQKPEAVQASAAPAPLPAPAARAGSAPDQALAAVLMEKETIAVAGEPACALTVRYGDGEPQPVTWRGEGCADILVRLVSIEDLRKIGQDSKLGEEARDDLARLPGGRAVYVEGGHSSALYPANVVNRVYEIPLAD